MKPVLICALIAVSVVLTIALTPASSWIFKNQVDILTSGTPSHPDDQLGLIEAFVPRWVASPDTYTGPDPAEQLAHAVLTPYPARNQLLLQYARRHPKDPLGWALLARMVCTLGGRGPDDAPYPDSTSRKVQEDAFSNGREACLAGAKLEPDNAWFPYMKAVFDMYLDRVDQIPQDLAAAASKPRYDSHLRDWSAAMSKALLLQKGYRGELPLMDLRASLLFPDLSKVKSLGRFLNRHGALREKRDLIQVQRNICREGQVLIEVLVAYSNARFALRPPVPVLQTGPTLSDAQWLELAGSFDAKLQSANVTPPLGGTLATYQSLEKFVKAGQKYIEALPLDFPGSRAENSSAAKWLLRTISPFVVLTALFLSVPFACAAWSFSMIKSETFRSMVPHIICLPAWLMTAPPIPTEGSPIAFVAPVLCLIQISLAFLHLGKRSPGARSRVAIAIGTAVALALIIVPDRSGVAPGLCFFLALALLSKRATAAAPKFASAATIVIFVIACLVAGAAMTYARLAGSPHGGELGALLFGLSAATLLAGKSASTARTAACASLILFSASYLVSSGLEVRANQADRLASRSMADEADTIRKMAGID